MKSAQTNEKQFISGGVWFSINEKENRKLSIFPLLLWNRRLAKNVKVSIQLCRVFNSREFQISGISNVIPYPKNIFVNVKAWLLYPFDQKALRFAEHIPVFSIVFAYWYAEQLTHSAYKLGCRNHKAKWKKRKSTIFNQLRCLMYTNRYITL